MATRLVDFHFVALEIIELLAYGSLQWMKKGGNVRKAVEALQTNSTRSAI